MSAPVDVVTPPPVSAPATNSFARITVVATVVAVLISAYWSGRVAVFDNHHEDLWIYSSGSWLGFQGWSPYDTERIHARVDEKWAGDPNLQGNSGFFLAPQAMLLFAPFAVLPWEWSKVIWCGLTIGMATVAALGLSRLGRAGALSPLVQNTPGDLSAQFTNDLPPWFTAAAVVAVLLNPLSQFVLIVGQTTLFVLTCVVVGQVAFSRGWKRIGCLLWALAFIKPHIALALLPLAWWLNGWKRAVEVAVWTGALNVLAGVVFYGNPLFVLDYLNYVQHGHKTVEFNRVAVNLQITSWNRLLVASGGPVVELGAMGTVMGYVLFGLLVAGRVRLIRRREDVCPTPSWAFALTGCAILSCCQLLPYELPLLALVLPYLGELFASGRRRDRIATGLILGGIGFAMIPGGEASDYYRLVRGLNLGTALSDVLESHRSLGVLLVSALVVESGPPRSVPPYLRRDRFAGAVAVGSTSVPSGVGV